MTMQQSERILIDGEIHSMSTEPLHPYLEKHPEINFRQMALASGRSIIVTSANHRSYNGTWAIKDDALWLVSLWSINSNIAVQWAGDVLEFKPYLLNPKNPNNHIPYEERGHPNPEGPIMATWYSGFLFVGNGAQKYPGEGMVQSYERYLAFKIVNGRVEGIRHMTHEEAGESGWEF